jgi:hypothetical protein
VERAVALGYECAPQDPGPGAKEAARLDVQALLEAHEGTWKAVSTGLIVLAFALGMLTGNGI